MKIFRDNDRAYLDWIQENENGFVVNTFRNPSRRCLVLHRATCWTIRTPARTNWTTTQYIKICSPSEEELQRWARENLGGDLKPCEICKPNAEDMKIISKKKR